MPWYALLYLIILSLWTVWAILDDIRTGKPALFFSVSNAIATLFIVLFVCGYYIPSLGMFLGSAVVPMLIGGFVWEVYSYSLDVQDLNNDDEFTENEKRWIKFLLQAFYIPFILLGYIAGAKLAINNLGF